MPDFRLTAYRNQYQEALTKLERLKTRIEGLKTKVLVSDAPEAVLEELRAAEAEYEAMKAEADNLRCLSQTGKSRTEIDQGNTIHWKKQYGGFNAHWPGRE